MSKQTLTAEQSTVSRDIVLVALASMLGLVTLPFALASPSAAQNPPATTNVNGTGWVREDHTDALSGAHYTQFTLSGTTLQGQVEHPTLVLRCEADPKADHGHARGHFLSGYIYTGKVVDATGSATGSGEVVHVQYRRDDEKKIQTEPFSPSKDYSSVFFQDVQLNEMLYGHFMPHKDGTGQQVKKFVIELPQYLGSDVVLQFNFPDSTDVAETCGAIWHK